MSTTNAHSNEKPHPALVWLRSIAAPVAVVSSVLGENETPSKYAWHLWGCVLIVAFSGTLLRAKRVVWDAKLGQPDACTERKYFISARLFRCFGFLQVFGCFLTLLIAVGELLAGDRVDWLTATNHASQAAISSVLFLNMGRIWWPVNTLASASKPFPRMESAIR